MNSSLVVTSPDSAQGAEKEEPSLAQLDRDHNPALVHHLFLGLDPTTKVNSILSYRHSGLLTKMKESI